MQWKRVAALLSLVSVSAIPPAPAIAQAPAYITQWGSSGRGDGQFDEPIGIALDPLGNVYVSDLYNYRVQKFSGSGGYLAQIPVVGGPAGVAINAEPCLFAVGTFAGVIAKFTLDGVPVAQWHSFGIVGGFIRSPWAVAPDGSGNVYVTDVGTSRVVLLASDGTYLRDLGSGQFDSPYGAAVGLGGVVYVTDIGNHRVEEFTSSGSFVRQWGSYGSGNGQFNQPYGLAVNAAGDVYVSDKGNHRIQVFTSTGLYLTQWGSLGSANGQFQAPTGMAVDAAGNVFVADAIANRIQKFGPVPTPAKSTSWGRLKRMYR